MDLTSGPVIARSASVRLESGSIISVEPSIAEVIAFGPSSSVKAIGMGELWHEMPS